MQHRHPIGNRGAHHARPRRTGGQIDIDSDQRAAFDDADRELLERVADLLAARVSASQPAART